MWIDQIRQFLDQRFKRFTAWVQGVSGRLPWAAAWKHACLPVLEGLGPGEVSFISDPQAGGCQADVSYHYRSLDCHLRIRDLETTPGMAHIYAALQGFRQV
jgi:hypothetical protein